MSARGLTSVALAVVACATLGASGAARANVVVARGKGAQLDEATAALKAELRQPVVEVIVDESTSVAAIEAKLQTDGGEPGLVIGVGARAAQLALKQTRAPVVHCMVLQDAALLDSERSVGVPLAVPASTQITALKLVAPKAKRVGVLYDPKFNAAFVTDAQRTAKSKGLALVAREVASAREAPAALDAIMNDVDALLLIPDATVMSKEMIQLVVARALEKRVPVFSYSESLVRLGAVAALAPGYAQNGKLCAQLALRVRAGEKPAALKNALQMSGTLVINVAAAQRLGLTVADELLKPPTVVVGR
jgi:putative ABC transport system substrate-binding protein